MDNGFPLITIMIPTYNQQDFIQRAINSALSLNYSNIQVVVCDDCSTDNTYEVAKEIIDPRLEVYKNKQNLGRVANYKHILEDLAKGSWVINCDGDDYLEQSDFFIRAMDELINNESIVLFTANRYKLSREGVKTKQELPHSEGLHNGNELFSKFYSLNNPLFHITSLYRREDAINCDFYTQDITSSDMESLLRLIVNSNFYHIQDNIAVWCEHEENESGNINVGKRLGNLQLIDSVFNYHKNNLNIKVLKKWKRKFYHIRLVRILNLFLSKYKYLHFFSFILRSVKRKPVYTLLALLDPRVVITFLLPFRKKLLRINK